MVFYEKTSGGKMGRIQNGDFDIEAAGQLALFPSWPFGVNSALESTRPWVNSARSIQLVVL